MNNRTVTIILSVALVLSAVIAARAVRDFHLPGNNQGYEPVQPIAYSHRLHAGELAVPCLYCHSAAEKSRHAGIPSLGTCMNCHKQVTAPFLDVRAEEKAAEKEKRKPRPIMSDEIRKIYRALSLNDEGKPDLSLKPAPVEWTRVHNLSDFVSFDHRPHVAAGVECQKCHGPVETMERVRQFEALSMGWCVNCHRATKVDAPLFAWPKSPEEKERHASTDCGSCHY